MIDVYVRSSDYSIVGEVAAITSLTLSEIYNAPGPWVLEVPAAVDAAALLAEPGAGIIVERDGVAILSGPVDSIEFSWSPDGSGIVFEGLGDLIGIAGRLAFPDPADVTQPLFALEDVRTGPAADVIGEYIDLNAGPGAAAYRRLGITLDVAVGAGTSVTGQARFRNLLDLVQELAAAGGVRISAIQSRGDAGPVVKIDEVADVSATAIFGPAFGNLASYRYSRARPGANDVWAGGSGDGAARTFRRRTGSLDGWPTIERLIDARQAATDAELDQAADAEIVRSAGSTFLSIAPLDVPGISWPSDYAVGDLVTVETEDGTQIVEAVKAVTVTYGPDGTQVAPEVADLPVELPLVSALRRLHSRTAYLETAK